MAKKRTCGLETKMYKNVELKKALKSPQSFLKNEQLRNMRRQRKLIKGIIIPTA